MPWRGKNSVRRRLTKAVLLTSIAGLAITCGAFQCYEWISFRQALTEQATTLADTVGLNSVASLTFEDQKTASEILSGLRSDPHIVGAYLYNAGGKSFAEYHRSMSGGKQRIEYREAVGAEFQSNCMILRRPIRLGDERIGTIAIVYDLTSLHAKMREYAVISLAVLIISILAMMLISARLLKPITRPVLELEELAALMTESEDYSLRAEVQTDDEVGQLVRSFNKMLDRIEERDRALQEAKDQLESRVVERTSELQMEVNERARAEKKLHASMKELEDLKYAMDQSCIVARTDAQGVITFVNEKFCSVSHHLPEELIGKTHAMVNSGHHPKEFFAELWATIKSGRPWRGEVKNRTKDGEFYWVDTTIVPFCDAGGKPFQYIAIRKDITNLKRIEEELRSAKDVAERASRAKSEFLANMSHEIRTPLNGIMGMTDLALDTELTPEQREYMETVKSSSDALLTVINDILDFSKIEAGKLDIECEEFDLPEAVEKPLKALTVRADEKGLELVCDIAPGVPQIVRGDAVRLRQVITNLMGNAIKFTEHGEVGLKIESDRGPDDQISLHITVWDTGVGIIPSKLKMIFDPFSQADTSTTRKYGGTGLGLTISARLVKMMGGKIWVESEVGVGSKFHFTVQVGAEERKGHLETARLPERLWGTRVLVVDDNHTNRRILEVMLRNWGMQAVCAESGEMALATLEAASGTAEAIQLILTDMHMPKMDGFELVERIRERRRENGPTILMLTSASGLRDFEHCRKLGIAAYLVKPVRQTELRETILRVMGAREEAKRETEESPGPKVRSEVSGEPLRVLVAEDNAVNQRLILRLLEKRGHRVTMAENGREALEALQGESFDLVFMDVQMPEMDGFEATARIRAREAGSGTHLPVIALTAHAMKGDREKCILGGMDDYLTKPIQPKELDELLVRWAGRVPVKA